VGSIDLGEVLINYICLLFSLCVHEAAHAAMADRCGDPSARFLGRISLNPLRHIDPLGTVILPLVMMLTGSRFMFGWAKPVPFNPRNLHNVRRDPVFISLAGPGSNFLLALVTALVLRVIAYLVGAMPDMQALIILIVVMKSLIMVNLVLMLFNLIPLPPLDGYHVLGYFLPSSAQRTLEQMGPFGLLIALVLINQTGLLLIPFKILYMIMMIISFFGTPLWGIVH
jgi:Zn-dependent protease